MFIQRNIKSICDAYGTTNDLNDNEKKTQSRSQVKVGDGMRDVADLEATSSIMAYDGTHEIETIPMWMFLALGLRT